MSIIQTNTQTISKLAAKAIIDAAKNIDKEYIVLALPGGRSVSGIYEEFRQSKDPVWKKIHIFLVDERVAEITDDDSNFKLIWESFACQLVKKGILPIANMHPLRINDSQDHGASNYLKILEKYGGAFDIVLVSSGEDGHIAALYPDHKALKTKGKHFIYLNDSPKPPKDRITSSVELIHGAKAIIILFVGEAKREAYQKFNNPHVPILDCPAKLASKMKNSIVYTDLK